MPSITAVTTEVQTRCNALTNGSTIQAVIDCAIAARKVEMAGGSITRTVLNAQIQRVIDLSAGGSAIEDLIVLAAMEAPLPPAAGATDNTPVGGFLTALGAGANYLRCDGSTYLKAAYPGLTPAMLSGLTQQVFTTEALPLVGTPIGVAAAVEGNISPLRFVPAPGGMYMIGATCSYTTTNVGSSFTRVRSLSGTTPWALQYSTDNGATFVDHTDRLQPLVDVLAGGPETSTAVASFSVDDVYVNGANVIITGRHGSLFYIAASHDSGVTFSSKTYNGGYANPCKLTGVGDTVVMTPCIASGGSGPFFTTDGGATWVQINSGAAYSSTKTPVVVLQNGTRFMLLFTDGTSAYTAALNPAAANWTASTVMPNTPNVSGGAVVGTKFIACGTGYIAVCTTVGTWVHQASASASITGVIQPTCSVVGTTILFAASATENQAFYCTDATTLPATTAIVADDNMTCPGQLRRAFVYAGEFYVTMAGCAIVESPTLLAGSWHDPLCVRATNTQPHSPSRVPVTKYGCMFFVSGGSVSARYVSYDGGLTVRPAAQAITTGPGAVIDAGTRLLALDSNQLLWQSTDGKTWNATGITRPTIPSSVSGQAILEVCGPYVYMIVPRADGVAYVYVSSNNGSTWTACSGISGSSLTPWLGFISGAPTRFTYHFNGRAYLGFMTFSTYWYYTLLSASDGVNFTTTLSGNAVSGRSYSRAAFIEHGGVLYYALADTSTMGCALRVPVSGAPILLAHSAMVPADVVSLTTQGICDLHSATPRWFLNSGPTVSMYTGVALTKSANYRPSHTAHVYQYDATALGLRTWDNSGTAINAPIARRCFMPDSADSFTLPNISNTWVRTSL